MVYIILLILLGILFLVAELLLLPGVTMGTIMSVVCYGTAVWLAFTQHGATTGWVVVAIVALLSLVATIISLRSKTWQRFSLSQEIDSTSQPAPDHELKVGDRAQTLSRLSPMGKITCSGHIYEAKSLDSYIDPKTDVEVVSFENFTVIVRKI